VLNLRYKISWWLDSLRFLDAWPRKRVILARDYEGLFQDSLLVGQHLDPD
jgi:hypothetical protein